MTYTELARKIKSAYKELKQNEVYKLFNVIWNMTLRNQKSQLKMMLDLEQLLLVIKRY